MIVLKMLFLSNVRPVTLLMDITYGFKKSVSLPEQVVKCVCA